MKRFWPTLLVSLAPLGAAAQSSEAPQVRQGEALVVVMRPSLLGGMTAASVFDVSAAETRFVGILYPGGRVGHVVKAGEHTFMVMGASTDFMKATVEAGRTYYALVTPGIGLFKTRFSFRPVRLHEIGGAEFAQWSSATHFVSNSPSGPEWFGKHAAEIEVKRAQTLPEWLGKPADERASQTLNVGDGVATTPR